MIWIFPNTQIYQKILPENSTVQHFIEHYKNAQQIIMYLSQCESMYTCVRPTQQK